jgi:hypothetical protein
MHPRRPGTLAMMMTFPALVACEGLGGPDFQGEPESPSSPDP